MTKNREEKKQQLKRNLEDYRAFDGNEKEIEKIKRKLHEIEIEEEFEEPLISIADRHVVLQSDVPHTEQTAGKQRDNYRDHRALRVIGIMDVYATPRCLIRRVKEGIEAVKYRLQFLKSATFLKLRLYLVDFSF